MDVELVGVKRFISGWGGEEKEKGLEAEELECGFAECILVDLALWTLPAELKNPQYSHPSKNNGGGLGLDQKNCQSQGMFPQSSWFRLRTR